MVNALKENHWPIPVGKYGKSMHKSTPRRHPANEGKSGWLAEMV